MIGDTGAAAFEEKGWTRTRDESSDSHRLISLHTDEAGGADLTFEWHKNEGTGGRWQTKGATARLGSTEPFSVSMTALFYVGSEVAPADVVRMVLQRAPAEVRDSVE